MAKRKDYEECDFLPGVIVGVLICFGVFLPTILPNSLSSETKHDIQAENICLQKGYAFASDYEYSHGEFDHVVCCDNNMTCKYIDCGGDC